MNEPGRKDQDRAAWADPQSLVRAGAHGDTAQRVHDLVMARQHHAPVALLQAQARLHLGTALPRRVA
jgi:hypothetical protein